jgi:hypothetical protein
MFEFLPKTLRGDAGVRSLRDALEQGQKRARSIWREG